MSPRENIQRLKVGAVEFYAMSGIGRSATVAD